MNPHPNWQAPFGPPPDDGPRAPARLVQEVRRLEQELVALDAEIATLGAQGRLFDDAFAAHRQQMPPGMVAFSAVEEPFVPEAWRLWSGQYRWYQQEKERLTWYALQLHAKRQALCTGLYQVETQLEVWHRSR